MISQADNYKTLRQTLEEMEENNLCIDRFLPETPWDTGRPLISFRREE